MKANKIAKTVVCSALFFTTLLPVKANAQVYINQNNDISGGISHVEYEYLGTYKITGYDTCVQCCGKSDGITASGATATVGVTCAVNGMDFGTQLYIRGIGYRTVQDRGGMKGKVIDVLCENHSDCYAITGYYEVYKVVEK